MAAGKKLVAAWGSNLASSPIVLAPNPKTRARFHSIKIPPNTKKEKSTKSKVRKQRNWSVWSFLPVFQFSKILSFGHRTRSWVLLFHRRWLGPKFAKVWVGNETKRNGKEEFRLPSSVVCFVPSPGLAARLLPSLKPICINGGLRNEPDQNWLEWLKTGCRVKVGFTPINTVLPGHNSIFFYYRHLSSWFSTLLSFVSLLL